MIVHKKIFSSTGYLENDPEESYGTDLGNLGSSTINSATIEELEEDAARLSWKEFKAKYSNYNEETLRKFYFRLESSAYIFNLKELYSEAVLRHKFEPLNEINNSFLLSVSKQIKKGFSRIESVAKATREIYPRIQFDRKGVIFSKVKSVKRRFQSEDLEESYDL